MANLEKGNFNGLFKEGPIPLEDELAFLLASRGIDTQPKTEIHQVEASIPLDQCTELEREQHPYLGYN